MLTATISDKVHEGTTNIEEGEGEILNWKWTPKKQMQQYRTRFYNVHYNSNQKTFLLSQSYIKHSIFNAISVAGYEPISEHDIVDIVLNPNADHHRHLTRHKFHYQSACYCLTELMNTCK